MSRIFAFSDRYRLHLTWFAFFLSFVVWFNFVSTAIQAEFGLEPVQIRIIQLKRLAIAPLKANSVHFNHLKNLRKP